MKTKVDGFVSRNLLRVVVVLCFAVTSVNNSVSAQNWPQWRGPDGSGISAETGIPTEWSDSKNIRWKAAIAGRGHSSPIVWGNRIFLTTSIEGPIVPGAQAVRHVRKGQEYLHPDSVGANHSYTLKLVCLDFETGRILWDKTVYEGTVYDNRHKKNTYASSTPATDGRFVYLSFEAEGLYCYDFEGKRIWKTSLGRIAKGGMGPGTSPVLFENLLILQCDQEYGEASFIAAVDKKTGKEVWRVPRDQRRSWATPLLVKVANRTELVTSGPDKIISYDPATGKELWTAPGVVSNPIPSPVAGSGLVFVTAGSDAKRVIAIKLGGSGDLTDTANLVWRYDKGTAYVPSPILYNDYLYLLTDGGAISGLEAATGKLIYQARLPVATKFTASPVAFEGKILLISEDGDGFIIKAGPVPEVLNANGLAEPVYASPAIVRGRILIRGEKNLYCIADAAEK
ncbi:MAG TPA: PQQ-binding-like beta-propeller repeat protein [Pyrinomonadaceae bacterium]|nr:PQQ-binding-like beta-propeller repeat protein [Pyrinomonadaceae bacterium]